MSSEFEVFTASNNPRSAAYIVWWCDLMYFLDFLPYDIKLMLHGMIFNDNSHRNGLPSQSNLV
jgi:hypothetical protein